MRYFFTLLTLMFRIRCLPDWMQDTTPDPHHFYRRTFTKKHQAKKNLVRNVWIAAGLLMLVNPVMHIALLIALPTTLLSFVILDETP